jgi:hypothetical protein
LTAEQVAKVLRDFKADYIHKQEEGSSVDNAQIEMDFNDLYEDDESYQPVLAVPKGDSAVVENTKKILQALDDLGGLTVGDESLVFKGTKIILPEQMEGDIPAAVKYLQDYEKQQETSFEFTRTFNYKPWDGAYAFDATMRRVFGSSGIGVTERTMFGDIPPRFVSINIDVNRKAQVPWGKVAFGPLSAVFKLGADMTEDGMVFVISVTAPRKHRRRLEGFFTAVEAELKQRSIYKGKAFDNAGEPVFLDTTLVNPDQVVYTDAVQRQLEANLWAPIRYTEQLRTLGIAIKRTVLVEGPYGTGKSLAGSLTAAEAVAHGWTYILCRPGQDLFNALNTAKMYAPAVVAYEDIDIIGTPDDPGEMSVLLDRLDGIQGKGSDVLALFTTNNVHKLHKGILRPGRIDAVINIAALDRKGFERLIEIAVPESARGEIDYDAVAEAMDGFLPAFVREAAERAVRYAFSRTGGESQVIDTSDLQLSSKEVRAQLELQEGSSDSRKVGDSLTVALQETMAEVNRNTTMQDYDMPFVVKLPTPAEQNHR